MKGGEREITKQCVRPPKQCEGWSLPRWRFGNGELFVARAHAQVRMRGARLLRLRSGRYRTCEGEQRVDCGGGGGGRRECDLAC